MAKRKAKTRAQLKAYRKRVAQAVEKGSTPQEVSDRLNVSLPWVKKACREFGVELKDRRFKENK